MNDDIFFFERVRNSAVIQTQDLLSTSRPIGPLTEEPKTSYIAALPRGLNSNWFTLFQSWSELKPWLNSATFKGQSWYVVLQGGLMLFIGNNSKHSWIMMFLLVTLSTKTSTQIMHNEMDIDVYVVCNYIFLNHSVCGKLNVIYSEVVGKVK